VTKQRTRRVDTQQLSHKVKIVLALLVDEWQLCDRAMVKRRLHCALDLDASELFEIERHERALYEKFTEDVELLDMLEAQQVDDIGGREANVSHCEERVVEGDEVLDELEHVLVARLLEFGVEEVEGGVEVGVEGFD
jgi:hypothetical protein